MEATEYDLILSVFDSNWQSGYLIFMSKLFSATVLRPNGARVNMSTNISIPVDMNVLSVRERGESHRKMRCVFWSGGTWSGDGCRIAHSSESETVCHCNHLTSFAVVFDKTVVECGDGRKVEAEACDDFNLFDSDGCSSECTIERGFSCSGGTLDSADTCIPSCGDGLTLAPEQCESFLYV